MIKALDAAQGGLPPESSGVELASNADPAAGPEIVERGGFIEPAVTPSDIPFLTQEEKRRILARIARVNPLDCFDESGAFDIVRAKKILPPGMVRHIAIHETTRLNAEGQPITERRINVLLVDPLSAVRLEDQMERRRERTASGSSSHSESQSDPDSPPPHPASPEYAHNLLRQKTKGLDEANHTLALLKKALAEKQDRQRRLFKELDEKDHQIEVASKTLSKLEGDASQRDTGCQPVQKKPETSTSPQPAAPKSQKSSKTLSGVEGSPQRDTGCQPVNPKHQALGKSLNELPNHEPPHYSGTPRPPPKAS